MAARSTDKTVPKQLTPFKPGQSGNPAGRPKGARNKLGEAFLHALHDNFVEKGASAIEECRKTKPEVYIRVIAGLLPSEVKVNVVQDMTDEQLDARIRQLAAALDLTIGDGRGDGRGAAQETAH